jgi:hypothetical protein
MYWDIRSAMMLELMRQRLTNTCLDTSPCFRAEAATMEVDTDFMPALIMSTPHSVQEGNSGLLGLYAMETYVSL